jgi:hypothetical protein
MMLAGAYFVCDLLVSGLSVAKCKRVALARPEFTRALPSGVGSNL